MALDDINDPEGAYNKRVIEAAQYFWGKWFKIARNSPRGPRFDCGSKKKRKLGKTQEWLSKRRRAVASGAKAVIAAGVSEDQDNEGFADGTWGDGHGKELAFQHSMQLKRQIEAYHQGALLDQEVTPELRSAIAEHAKSESKNLSTNRRQVDKRREVIAAAARAMPVFEFSGRRWFGQSAHPTMLTWVLQSEICVSLFQCIPCRSHPTPASIALHMGWSAPSQGVVCVSWAGVIFFASRRAQWT